MDSTFLALIGQKLSIFIDANFTKVEQIPARYHLVICPISLLSNMKESHSSAHIDSEWKAAQTALLLKPNTKSLEGNQVQA